MPLLLRIEVLRRVSNLFHLNVDCCQRMRAFVVVKNTYAHLLMASLMHIFSFLWDPARRLIVKFQRLEEPLVPPFLANWSVFLVLSKRFMIRFRVFSSCHVGILSHICIRRVEIQNFKNVL